MRIPELQRAADATAAERRSIVDVIYNAGVYLRSVGDTDGADHLGRWTELLARPGATVVVAGESGAGKSSVVNGILGRRLSPADVLTTTMVPIRIGWAPTESIHAITVDDDGIFTEVEMDARSFERIVVDGDPAVGSSVIESFAFGVPHPLLESGLTFIDTPSISGGLGSPAGGAILGLIAEADAVLFVSDSGQELSFPEVEFLEMAYAISAPLTTVVKTRIDLYADWRRVVDIDRGHLREHLDSAEVVGVSASLLDAAHRLGDDDVARASGFPGLTWLLGTTVVTSSIQQRIADAAAEVQDRLDLAMDELLLQRMTLSDRSEQTRVEHDLQRSEQRLRRLETEWGDAFGHVLSRFRVEAQRGLDDRLRDVSVELLAAIDETDPVATWPAIETRVHRAANMAIADYLQSTADQAELVIDRMAQFLDVDRSELTIDTSGFRTGPFGVSSELERPEFQGGRQGRAFDVVRGSASSGMLGLGGGAAVSGGASFAFYGGASLTTVFGMGLAGAAVASLGPAVGVVAAISGARVLLRRTKSTDIDAQRRDAKQSIRDYLNEISRQISRSVENSHAQALYELRSSMKGQMEQLHQRTIRSIEQLRVDQARSTQETAERLAELEPLLEQCAIVAAHARRSQHRLARPDFQIPNTLLDHAAPSAE